MPERKQFLPLLPFALAGGLLLSGCSAPSQADSDAFSYPTVGPQKDSVTQVIMDPLRIGVVTHTPTPEATSTPANTATATLETKTSTPTATGTVKATATGTLVPRTPTQTLTATILPSPTATSTVGITPTAERGFTPTITLTATATIESTSLPTSTATLIPTATLTATALPTSTPTVVETPRPFPTPPEIVAVEPEPTSVPNYSQIMRNDFGITVTNPQNFQEQTGWLAEDLSHPSRARLLTRVNNSTITFGDRGNFFQGCENKRIQLNGSSISRNSTLYAGIHELGHRAECDLVSEPVYQELIASFNAEGAVSGYPITLCGHTSPGNIITRFKENLAELIANWYRDRPLMRADCMVANETPFSEERFPRQSAIMRRLFGPRTVLD